jgi:hypothetical protein
MSKQRRKVGRPKNPQGEGTAIISLRVNEGLLAQLRTAADRAGHGNLSREISNRLRLSLAREQHEGRDPALRALLFMIGALAERISVGWISFEKASRPQPQTLWRTDSVRFRAFKFAVKKLLDTLKEPRERWTKQEFEKWAKGVEKFESPEFAKQVIELNASPEALGAYHFAGLWAHSEKKQFTDREREIVRQYSGVYGIPEYEIYQLPNARKALELKYSTIHDSAATSASLRRIMRSKVPKGRIISTRKPKDESR